MEGATIAEIADIGDVKENDVPDEFTTFADAEVVGVLTLKSYSTCLACKSEVTPTMGKLGSCTKCDMLQCIDWCKKQLNAKLVTASNEMYLTLNCVWQQCKRDCTARSDC